MVNEQIVNGMTEYEKMLHNLPYDYTNKEVQANILQAYYAMRDLNQCGAWDMDELHRCTHALIPDDVVVAGNPARIIKHN